MPPKAKKTDPKGQGGLVEDETGIPKNEVTFKFNFQVKQTEVADIMIMFEWVNDSDSSLRQKLDTDLIENWEQVNSDDAALLKFETELSPIVVEDKFVKNLCSDKFYIHFVSTEDQIVKDSIYVRYSSLITAKGQPQFDFYHDRVKIPQIESFRITVTADKELLTPLYRDYLNPLEICIIGAKDMPNNNTGYNTYEPVYVEARFFDGTLIKTHPIAHASTYKWRHKQVVLVGLMDPIKLTENLKSLPLLFQIHDQDEVAKNLIKEFKHLTGIKYEEPEPPVEAIDPKAKGAKGAAAAKDQKKPGDAADAKKKEAPAKDAKDAKGKKDPKKKKDVKTFEPIKEEDTRQFIRTNYGVSTFNLNDLLNPHANSLKLRNYILPVSKYENKDSKNLDLNTTARKELQEAHIACDYMSNESYLVVTFEIAHGIRPFKKPSVHAEEPVKTELAKVKQAAAKPSSGAVKDRKTAVPEEVPKAEVQPEKAIFERAVYVFPYKSAEYTPKLLSIIHDINMQAFNLTDANPLFISTKMLTEEERNNKYLDIITGVEFIDNEYRTFILEGLSDKAMKRLEEHFPKLEANSKNLKILKNPNIKFKNRLYSDFNIDIKKVKLRENLSKLLIKSDVYLRSKVPENIYGILVAFNEIRNCDSMKAVIASNLFPEVENIIGMERKYGDALTEEDVSGKETLNFKLVTRTAAKISKIGSELGLSNLQSSVSAGGRASSRISPVGGVSGDSIDREQTNLTEMKKPKLRFDSPPAPIDKYALHMTKLYPITEGQELYTQAGTKLNIYEKQKTELREIARNDPNNFYTYSANYLSLSIDPFTPQEGRRQDEDENRRLWKTPKGFQTVLKKDKLDYIKHPLYLHESRRDDLSQNPWYQVKAEEKKGLAYVRGNPIRNGLDFKLGVTGDKFFSQPEIIEADKLSPVEKERELLETRRRQEEEWNSKMVVDKKHFYTSLRMNKSSQLDKIQDIREGVAIKKGLTLSDKKLKTTSLGTAKAVLESPISMYLSEKWASTTNKNFFERKVDMQKTVSHFDFNTNIKQKEQYNMIYKPIREIFPK